MKIIPLILTLSLAVSLNATPIKSDEWKTKLESVIQQYDKNGVVMINNGTYVYQYHTQVYKIHTITSKLGDISEKVIDRVGPKVDGILLQVSVRNGEYLGQLMIPQVLKEPYWTTFINAYPVADNKYLWLSLSYGSRSNRNFIADLKTSFGPIRPAPIEKPRFGLYLVTKDAKELDKIELDSSPLLTEDDILDYNWTNHILYITETAAKRIPKVDSWGKPFVIIVDGKRAYRGAFWNSGSSISHPHPVIKVLPPIPITTLKIDRRYPDWPTKGEPDPRDNESVKKVFRELGKLTEK